MSGRSGQKVIQVAASGWDGIAEETRGEGNQGPAGGKIPRRKE